MTNKEILIKLYKENKLDKEDVFKSPQGWTIIRRSGIEKIQYANNIEVSYNIIDSREGFHAIHAVGKFEDKVIESFASATKENCKQKFRLEICEKRVLARVVIKLMGLVGVYGEDEMSHQGNNKVDEL